MSMIVNSVCLFPMMAKRLQSNILVGALCVCSVSAGFCQTGHFITRLGSSLQLDGRPFYFLGANAYYLMEESARGDTSTARTLFETTRRLGMNVVRTWAFFDSPDSLNPAVIQLRPGVLNERALHALDYVIWQAQQHGVRLLLPLVNNWDDYGGMNQYVRWRMEQTTPHSAISASRYTQTERLSVVVGSRDQHYRVALNELLGHDDFYTDSTIREWYKAYIKSLLRRVNTFSGVTYNNDPTILGWELANEPRSSDVSCQIVARWADDISAFLKQMDTNHLVGTGEEGFDNSSAGYSLGAYGGDGWLLNGTSGISFKTNSTLRCVDFASVHLYPQAWGLSNSAGNVWIKDHVRLATLSGKPLVVGEFGVRDEQAAVYDSWLTTVLLDGGSGACVWQLLGGDRTNNDGLGIRCPESGFVCTMLANRAEEFDVKSTFGKLNPPPLFLLLQNYPNPFNFQTTISYSLPTDSFVRLSLFSSIGEIVKTFVEEFQHAGTRKELLDVGSLASGAYFYRVSTHPVAGQPESSTGKMVILK